MLDDIDSLAKQVLCNEDFLPDAFSSDEEVFELREKNDDSCLYINTNNLLNHEASSILKSLAKAPNKLYRIGELVDLLNIKDNTLRYWENKFPEFLKPVKNKGGQRLYKLKDIEYLLKIKNLLIVEKLSIQGVKKKLSSNKNNETMQSVSIELLYIIKDELANIQTILLKNYENLTRLDSGE